MTKYPEVITKEILEKSADITEDEILVDIADTEREISDLTEEIKWHGRMAESTSPNAKILYSKLCLIYG